MRRQEQQKGFVLILVIVMLVIVALLSVGMVCRSLGQSVAAAKKGDELQRRWGEISLRHTVLNRAEILLRTAELREGIKQPTLQTTIKLKYHTFYLILSDEQAKLNINTAFRYGGEQAVRKMLFENAVPWTVRLHPDSRAARNSSYPPAFASWGQVYDFSILPENHHLMLTQLGERITCWGNGQLNIHRAESHIIRTACEWVASPQAALALVEWQREHPGGNFERLLREADISDQDRRAFRRVLTDRSRCHSLWTITRNANRSWLRFDVKSADGVSGNDIETFYY